MIELDWMLEKYYTGEYKKKLINYKRFCELGIILFLVLLYIFSRNYQMPLLSTQFVKAYRQIDLQKYIPERIKIVKKHKIPMSGIQNVATDQSSLDFAEIVDSDLLNNDVSSVLNRQHERSLQNVPEHENTRLTRHRLMMNDIESSFQIQESKDYLKDNATQLAPSILIEPKTIGPTVSINDNMATQKNVGRRQIYPGPEKSAIVNDKIIPETGVVHIPLISREKVSKRPDISVIIDELMAWMKKHPYEFNEVVKSFMMYEKNDLTSKVAFQYKDRLFELYLLYKVKTKEIRICLIEGEQSTMLIDDGFKKQSNYLRTGSISRIDGNSIFSFSTTQYPASEKKTYDFYQFFLSWWEQAKLET